MGLVTICSSGGDFAYDETHSWPASTALAYFTLAYISRNPVWTLLFAWIWEILEYSLIFLHAKLVADVDSPAAAWIVSAVPESAIDGSTSYPQNHHHTNVAACILSPVFSFVVSPLLIFSAVCLYSVAIERIAGIRYNTSPKALGPCGLRIIYYAGFLFVIFFSSTTLFVRHSRMQEIGSAIEDPGGNELDPDIGLIMGAMAFIMLTSTIPIYVAQHMSAADARNAFLAYTVYTVCAAFLVIFSEFAGPLLNIRSTWLRTMTALAILWFACILVGGVRLGLQCRRKLGNIEF